MATWSVLQIHGSTRIANKLSDFHQILFVWGAIGFDFKSKLISAPGKVTGEIYRSFLEENLTRPLEDQDCKKNSFLPITLLGIQQKW
jgi:hypothetical protein